MKTKEIYFIKMTNFLMGRYKFDKPIEIRRDNRMDCPCAIDNWGNNDKILVRYNTKRLKGESYPYILNFILHEIGHLIHNMPYECDIDCIKSERKAEKFALKEMKKDYNKEYNILIKAFEKDKALLKIFKEIRNPYYWAFKNIKEYKSTISKEDLLWLKKQTKKIKNY